MKLSEPPDDCREAAESTLESAAGTAPSSEAPSIQVPPFIAVIFLHRRVTGPAQIKIRAAHLAGPDVAFRFSCRLPGRVFCPSEFFITGYIHHLQSELSLLVCRRSCACHFIRPCGKDRIQKGVLREVIDKWNNHVAEKQKDPRRGRNGSHRKAGGAKCLTASPKSAGLPGPG